MLEFWENNEKWALKYAIHEYFFLSIGYEKKIHIFVVGNELLNFSSIRLLFFIQNIFIFVN